MNLLSKVLTSKISVKKRDGREYNDVPANINSRKNTIIVADTTVPFEDGDKIIHYRQNGTSASFIVTDANFVEPPHGSDFPNSYMLTVKKENQIGNNERATSVNYNLYGSQSRVNINSQDHSTNIIQKDLVGIFDDLKNTISSHIPTEDAEALLQTVREMENTVGKKSFIQAYQDFIELAANHATVLAPFLPALAHLLSSL